MSCNFDFLQNNEDGMGYFHAADLLEQEYAMESYSSDVIKINQGLLKFGGLTNGCNGHKMLLIC